MELCEEEEVLDALRELCELAEVLEALDADVELTEVELWLDPEELTELEELLRELFEKKFPNFSRCLFHSQSTRSLPISPLQEKEEFTYEFSFTFFAIPTATMENVTMPTTVAERMALVVVRIVERGEGVHCASYDERPAMRLP